MDFKEEIIQNINNNIERVTDLFYKQKHQEGYVEFITLIDDIFELLNAVASSNTEEECKALDQKLRGTLMEAMEALTKKDHILLADILKYDIKDLLNEILDKL